MADTMDVYEVSSLSTGLTWYVQAKSAQHAAGRVFGALAKVDRLQDEEPDSTSVSTPVLAVTVWTVSL